MAEENLILKARELVLEYVNENLPASEEGLLVELNEIHVLLTRQVLRNWSLIITTSFPNDHIYEVRIDNFKNEIRLMVFGKTDLITYPHGVE